MNKVLDKLVRSLMQHKTWVFSGVGVAVPLAVLGYIVVLYLPIQSEIQHKAEPTITAEELTKMLVEELKKQRPVTSLEEEQDIEEIRTRVDHLTREVKRLSLLLEQRSLASDATSSASTAGQTGFLEAVNHSPYLRMRERVFLRESPEIREYLINRWEIYMRFTTELGSALDSVDLLLPQDLEGLVTQSLVYSDPELVHISKNLSIQHRDLTSLIGRLLVGAYTQTRPQ